MLPILILAFNRPIQLTQTLNSIIDQPHGPIYVSVDGPRIDRLQETDEVCAVIKKFRNLGLIKDVLILDRNYGTLDGIARGINWFFDHNSEGLIIEDDLILHSPVLQEAEIIFNLLRTDGKLGSIGFRNIVPKEKLTEADASYRYSLLSVSHGWGTTSEKWHFFKSEINNIEWYKLFKEIKKKYGASIAIHMLLNYLNDSKNELNKRHLCHWDNRWQVTHFIQDWKVVSLNINRIEYNGYGKDATHTKFASSKSSNEYYSNKSLLNWRTPTDLSIDFKADFYVLKDFGIDKYFKQKLALKTRLSNILKKLD